MKTIASTRWAATEFADLRQDAFRRLDPRRYDADERGALIEYCCTQIRRDGDSADVSPHAWLLGEFNLPRSAHEILQRVASANTRPLRERWIALRPLARYPAPRALRILGELATHASPDMRVCAVDALGSIGPHARSALPVLRDVLHADAHQRVRWCASNAITAITGEPNAEWAGPPRADVIDLIHRFSDDYTIDAFLLELQVQLHASSRSHRSLEALWELDAFRQVVLPEVEAASSRFSPLVHYGGASDDQIGSDALAGVLAAVLSPSSSPIHIRNRAGLQSWVRYRVRETQEQEQPIGPRKRTRSQRLLAADGTTRKSRRVHTRFSSFNNLARQSDTAHLSDLMDLRDALDMLDEPSQQIITLRFYDRLTLAAIASRIECSTAEAARRCNTALDHLRRILLNS
jgi:RNA polymerase sigma factor (sigma-70 family)